MATQNCLISFRIADENGSTKSYQEYGSFDDATATLNSLLTAVQLRASNLDGVTDGKIESMAVTMYWALPAGLKADPAVGSDVEETGLFTFTTEAPGGKVFSQDVPAAAQAIFVGRTIDPAQQDVVNYVNALKSQAGTISNKDDKWAYTLTALKSGAKKFRK